MIRVIVESPYAGDTLLHIAYARACLRDCLERGESPFASHLLYTQPGVLRDEVPAERVMGCEAGFSWREVAELTVVYTDLGISEGMRWGIEDAERKGHRVEYRTLPPAALAAVRRNPVAKGIHSIDVPRSERRERHLERVESDAEPIRSRRDGERRR